jgi:glycosyltransferase involved in cell wall biosynthesis
MDKVMKEPIISVLMSVYNGEPFLEECIRSVLNQTFIEFEFLIINDGSTDGSQTLIEKFHDNRIRLLNQKNSGLVASLNRGLDEAKGEYIARIDADDVWAREKLELQIHFLENNPKIDLLGTDFASFLKEPKSLTATNTFPQDNIELKRRLLLGNTFAHGAIIMRRSSALSAGKYSTNFGPCEDYDLWRRIARNGTIGNLPLVLFFYRLNPNGISQNSEAQEELYRLQIQNEEWNERFWWYSPLGFFSLWLKSNNRTALVNDRHALINEAKKRKHYFVVFALLLETFLLRPKSFFGYILRSLNLREN